MASFLRSGSPGSWLRTHYKEIFYLVKLIHNENWKNTDLDADRENLKITILLNAKLIKLKLRKLKEKRTLEKPFNNQG